LYEGLAELPERLQLLIELRFFQEKTQMEVAQLFGVSQVQICRLEKNALNQLRGFYQNDA
jgi:RNA polymerase sporulation-specific sigma factor